MALIESQGEIPPSGLIVCMMENNNGHMTFERINRNALAISERLHDKHRIYAGIPIKSNEETVSIENIDEILISMQVKGYLDVIRSGWIPCLPTETKETTLYYLCNDTNAEQSSDVWKFSKNNHDLIVPSGAIITAAKEVIKEYYFYHPF